MHLIFTKLNGKYDRLDIRRGDAPPMKIDCPKQRIIPHDMVHYAVESTLAARGFLGRVRDGENADFTMKPETESDGVERLVEVFQGDAWSGGTSAAADMLDLYRVTCEERACPMLPVGPDDIEAVRAKIAELDAAWQALPVGQAMELTLDSAHGH